MIIENFFLAFDINKLNINNFWFKFFIKYKEKICINDNTQILNNVKYKSYYLIIKWLLSFYYI